MAYYKNVMKKLHSKKSAECECVFGNGKLSLFDLDSIRVKVLASSAAVVFGIVILLLSVMAISNPDAVHPNTESAGLNSGVGATAAALFKLEYYLPYPGILPDSPLYKIKALRDRISLWITFDKTEKARKELLYADKRINAAIFLMQQGKKSLSVTTATKAEKYLESAVTITMEAVKNGKNEKVLLTDLGSSTVKHLLVLESLIVQVSGPDQEALKAAVKTTEISQARVKQALLE